MSYSPDGKTLSYTALTTQGKYLMVGNEKVGPYINFSNFVYSPDGKMLAYIFIDGQKKYNISVGNKTFGPYADADALIFAPDNKTIAAVVGITNLFGDNYVLAGDTKFGPYYRVKDHTSNEEPLKYSSDGKVLMYSIQIVKDGAWIDCSIVNGLPCIANICGTHGVWIKDGAVWTSD